MLSYGPGSEITTYQEVTEGTNSQILGAQDANRPVPLLLQGNDWNHCHSFKASLKLTSCHHPETNELQVSSLYPVLKMPSNGGLYRSC